MRTTIILSQLTYQKFKTYVTKNNCIFLTARIHEPTDIDYIIDQQNLVTISVGAYKTEYSKVSWMAVYYIQQAYNVVMMSMRCNDVASKPAQRLLCVMCPLDARIKHAYKNEIHTNSK